MGIERDLSKIEKSKDSLNMSGDGLVMPAGLKDEIRRNSKVDKDIMLENPGKYNLEIHELAAQNLKVSFGFESACKSCLLLSSTREGINTILHIQNDDLDESFELFEILLAHFKTEHGELHHTVGSCLHNIGIVLLRSQDYEQALSSFQQAVRVRKGSMGRDHADVAVSLVKVGITQLLLCKFDEALYTFRDALSIRRHALGHLHPSTARIYNNIGCVHVEFKELRQARRAFESALDVQRSALCDEPGNEQLLFGIATTLCNLGFLYSSRGDHEKTSLVLKEAAGFQQRVFGPAHSTVLSIQDSLADSYGKSGDNLNALQTYKTIIAGLEGDERVGQPLSSRKMRAIAIVFYKMSRICRKQNDHESALRFLCNSVSYVKELGAPQLLEKVEEEMDQVKQELHKAKFDWV
jgi:tetratricopeptide (TPR) repeat protein